MQRLDHGDHGDHHLAEDHGVVAVMDGADPDSGTAWEVGYAYGTKKPIMLIRTDLRRTGSSGDYNAMLTQSATVRLDLPVAPTTGVIAAILEALARIEAGEATDG